MVRTSRRAGRASTLQGHPPFEAGQEVDAVRADPNGRRSFLAKDPLASCGFPCRQRGHRRSQLQVVGVCDRCVETSDRHQLDRRLPVLQRNRSLHVGTRLRTHRERRVHCGQGRQCERLSLQRLKSKAGVIAFTKLLGKETANKNISVNCITPAAARTRIFDQMSQEHIDFMLSRIPRGRFLEVNEVNAMVAWLVSEENSFTTGAVFDISGGRATY